MDIFVGLDIGGTKIMVAAADAAGTLLRRLRTETPTALDPGLQLLKEMVTEVRGADRIMGMGAAVGGPLDWESGVVSPLHQPQWREVPLRAIFEQAFGCPLAVDVDTNVAALGEWAVDGEKPGRLLYVTVSTGMGGGFLVDGQIYRGANGAHPEVAHQAIPFRCAHPERVACECGAVDCLEALVSGNGIRRVYGRAAEDLDAGEWEDVAYNLGLGLRNMAVILVPDVIVLGGGVAVGGGESLLARARQVMAERLFLTPVPTLRLSRLGYDTALHGAVNLARQRHSH